MLAVLLVRCPDALRADFQRYYGLDLDEVGVTIRVRRAADLAANLPQEAQCWPRIDKRMTWGVRDHLLADIVDNTSFIAWTKTEEAQKRHVKWKGQLQRPGISRNRIVGPKGLSTDEIDRILSMPRKPLKG